MRNFRLIREGQERPVAEGVVFTSERGVIQWLDTDHGPETNEFYRVDWVEMMHCRDGVTSLVWIDPPCTCTPEQDILVKV